MRSNLSYSVAVAALVPILLASVGQAASPGTSSRTFTAQETAAIKDGPAIGKELLPRIDPSKLPPVTRTIPEGARGMSGSMSDGRTVFSTGSGAVVEPQAFGTSKLPFTTSRVAVGPLGINAPGATPVSSYPYRAAGKLLFNKGTSGFICSASMIKPGLLVTAAHCVHDYGKGAAGFYTNVRFQPAHYANTTPSPIAPYGTWTARQVWIATAYRNGTDTCTVVGVVCNNDLAVVLMNKNANGQFPGSVVGWYGYGWNGYSHVVSPILGNRTVAQISQLGYPGAFDNGWQMQRTDAVGYYVQSGNLKNTQMGSAQTGGSSGGPWIVNLGNVPVVGGGQDRGSAANQSVVGVTSWGFTDTAPNEQGASFFGQNVQFPAADYGGRGAGNIGALVNAACTSASALPGSC